MQWTGWAVLLLGVAAGGCVPKSPAGESPDGVGASDPCAVVRCAAGTHCEASDGQAQCVADATGCATARCEAGTHCEEVEGQPVCFADESAAAGCASLSCLAGTRCEVVDGVAQCISSEPAGAACGATTCPAGQVCCNASCGICTPPGGVCIQLACEGPPPSN